MTGIILLYTLYGMFIIAVYNNKVDRASPFVPRREICDLRNPRVLKIILWWTDAHNGETHVTIPLA